MSRFNELLFRTMLSKVGQKLLGKRFRKYCLQAGRPIRETLPVDVILAGYPKSGTTWFLMLAAGLIYGPDFAAAPLAVLFELMPDMHTQQFYRRYSTPTYFRTFDLPAPPYRKVIHLVRDGRDVMTSLWNFNQHFRQGRFATDMMTMLHTGKGMFPCRWEEYIRAWQANPHHAEILEIRYEDLLTSPQASLQKVSQFIGVERSPAELDRIIDNCQFNKMDKREAESKAMPKVPQEGQFFRKGKAGSFREEMSPEALALFQQQAGDVLKSLGYPLV
jgi:hypothetical protein